MGALTGVDQPDVPGFELAYERASAPELSMYVAINLPAESWINLCPPPTAKELGPTSLSAATIDAATVAVALAEWLRVPLVPVTVTVKVPADADEKERVEEADPTAARETLLGLAETTGPDGDDDTERAMVPEKLFRLDREIVEVEVPPAVAENDDGFNEILKSGLFVDPTVTVPDACPLTPLESVTFNVAE